MILNILDQKFWSPQNWRFEKLVHEFIFSNDKNRWSKI